MSGITYINRVTGATNNLVYLETSDTTATATASGYITAQTPTITTLNDGAWTWEANDCIMLSASDGISWCTINSTFTTLSSLGALGPVVDTTTLATATPGTVRAFTGKISDSVLMTSGNIVGVRGEADYVGASGGFIYGVQGKIIPTGVVSGSSWNAGVFGQLDFHAATVNAGQMAPIWGDYGATSGTLTNQTGLYGIAMTNTTAAVLEGQLYLYGGAQNLMLLNTNAGLSGVTYYKAAGTSGGSAGDATHCAAQQVLKININGADAYIPVFTQNT